MKRMWVVIGSLFLGSPSGFSASAPAKPADVEETSPEAAKAAAKEASSEADQWAAKMKATTPTTPKTPPAPEPEEKPAEESKPVEAAKPVEAVRPAEAAKPATPPPAATPKRTGLNEIRGKLLSKSYDPKAIRLTVAGGFNVEITYDAKTSVQSNGTTLSIEDLGYDDAIVVRYAGKDLYAIEIERASRAPRPE